MKDQQHNRSDEVRNDHSENDARKSENKTADIESDRDDQLTAGNQTPEIATNDGSVIETLDTALHGTPGWSEGENMSGSNRADYYEARSNGKSDVEEELDELRERNKAGSGHDAKAG